MKSFMRGLSIPLIALILWEISGRIGAIPLETFSRPSDIALSGAEIVLSGDLFVGTLQTLVAACAGILLATIVGVPLGIVIGTSSIGKLMIGPTLDALRSVPPVALIPLSLLIFGFGISMESIVVAFASIWSIIIATSAAVKAIEPRLAEVASALEIGAVDYIKKFVLPAAIARITVGLRVAIGISLVVAVTVEIVVNPRGLGYQLILAQQSLRPDVMYAILFWVGTIGWLINTLLVAFDRQFLSHFGVGGRRT